MINLRQRLTAPPRPEPLGRWFACPVRNHRVTLDNCRDCRSFILCKTAASEEMAEEYRYPPEGA